MLTEDQIKECRAHLAKYLDACAENWLKAQVKNGLAISQTDMHGIVYWQSAETMAAAQFACAINGMEADEMEAIFDDAQEAGIDRAKGEIKTLCEGGKIGIA